MDKFALIRKSERKDVAAVSENLIEQVLDVLVNQLGHKMQDAKKMVSDAMQRNNAISTPEELFEEVYRGEKMP